MSSATAAVQPNAPALSTRQYRDQYYTQQPSGSAPNSTAPSSSNRRAKHSSNGNSPQTPTQHYSPAESSTSTVTTPRALPPPPLTNKSPVLPMTATSNNSSGPPFAPPPRTSSTQRNQTGTAPGSENPSRSASGHLRENESPQQSAASSTSAAQSRRRQQGASRESAPQSSGSSSGRGKAPGGSRSGTTSERPPMGADLPREDSTIVSRIVIDDPAVDLGREQERMAESRPIRTDSDLDSSMAGLTLVGSEGVDDGGRGASNTHTRQERQERSHGRHKETKFGEYILGQTLGEGEFGKVKMGWKREGGVQVAIKLIRRESLGTNPSRLPKIYREISILRGLKHPNIVKLHEMVETERHIGIILEYASGGELFDYILQHRFLKDPAARRLFAQLISGVGYLHKKGIVHRDLKLENLLLDRNKNIIITDFGFANTFNSDDELGEDVEFNLSDKDFVKKMGLDYVRDDGHRRGDLMQTSCGSPCYAAPELVVSDSLYTGRKVDVWSCGVILEYAMLAGYLPFDDDPANPEGDNINLLYKYIVSTPLTFPEYVTPHARDLLKRILVPDPRKRADLFEVARHSWLSEYAHVVAFITSSTTTSNDIANTTVPSEDAYEPPHLARSASVREPSKAHATPPTIGGLAQKHGQIDQTDKPKTTRDAKRRTVQVEYVAPQSSTVRGDGPVSPTAAAAAAAQAKTRARSEDQGPVEVNTTDGYHSQRRAPTSTMLPPARPGQQRAASESVDPSIIPVNNSTRPSTGGSMSGNSRLPSRGNSYGQPAVGVAKEQAQGHFSQPRGKQYTVTLPNAQVDNGSYSQSSSKRESAAYLQEQQRPQRESYQGRSHKRSSTISELGGKLFGKRNSLFESKESKTSNDMTKPSRSHPPVSMTKPIPNEPEPRRSTESRRTSFSFGRKNTSSKEQEGVTSHRSSRRFSFIPASIANTFSSNRNSQHYPPGSSDSLDMRQPSRSRTNSRPRMGFGRSESRSPSRSTTTSNLPTMGDQFDRPRDSPKQRVPSAPTQAPAANRSQRYSSGNYPPQEAYLSNDNTHFASQPSGNGEYYRNVSNAAPPRDDQHDQYDQQNYRPHYPAGFNTYEDEYHPQRKGQNVLQKPNRKFPEGNEKEGHGGRAQRVMDFFRSRGKARGGE